MNELVVKTQNDLLNFANDFIKQNNIIVSKNYNVTNAMISFFNNVLTTKDKNGKTALEVCTPLSIQNAVTECISNELNPQKNQSYFIVYGNELKSQKSYFGNAKQARDVANVIIRSQVVREGDQIDIETRIDGSMVIYHKTNIKNIDKPITHAFAVATDVNTGRVVDSDIMSIAEIKKSWAKSKNGGSVSKEFPHEMARRTVINRLAKHFINTSDDSHKVFITDGNGNPIIVESYNDLPQPTSVEYTINTDEQLKKEQTKYEPAENENVVVATTETLKLDPIIDETSIPENAIEIDYNEVKGGKNKDKYKVIPNTFNKSTYTCKVIPLNNEQ